MRPLGRCWLAFGLLLGCADRKEVISGDSGTELLDAGMPEVVTARADARVPANDARVRDASLAQAEVCDGIDNDGNGTIDDVDVGQDGVCDCLLIATLGKPGGSGKGDVFGSWLDQRSDNGATDLADRELTPELLAGFQVIVVEAVNDRRPYTTAELDALRAWVESGGGLLTLTGYAGSDERTNVNAILGRFGLDYAAQSILQRNGAMTIPVRSWVPHPVTMGVTAVGVDTGYEVQGDGETLASQGGFDLLKAEEVGAGHVLAWGDEWITYDSEWTNDTDYQVEQLWLNMIKWLTPARVCQVPPVVVF